MFKIGAELGAGRIHTLGEGSSESKICPDYRNYMQDFNMKLSIAGFKKN